MGTKMTDLLIYTSILYYINQYNISPTLTQIQQLTQASIPTIRKSIKKLDGIYFKIIKSGRCQEYKLIKNENYNITDYEFLTNSDITFEDKKYILATHYNNYEKHFNRRSN